MATLQWIPDRSSFRDDDQEGSAKKLIPLSDFSCTLLRMDWNLAIEKNTHALAQIVSGLWKLVGLSCFSAKPSGLPSAHALAPRLNASSAPLDGASLVCRSTAATEGRHPPDSLPPVGVRRTGSDAWREPMKQGDVAAEPVGVTHSPLGSSPPPIPTSRAARAHVPPHKGEAEFVSSSSRGLSTGSREPEQEIGSRLEHVWRHSSQTGPDDGWVDPVNKSRDDELFDSEDDSGEKALRGSRSKCDKHLCHCANARSPDGEQEKNISPITRHILVRTLRTVEAALRRLIVLYVYVHGVKAVVRKRQDKRDRPLPDFASFGSGVGDRPPVFRLFDPRKPLTLLADWSKHEGNVYGASTLRQAQGEGFGLSSSDLSTSSSSSSDLFRGSTRGSNGSAEEIIQRLAQLSGNTFNNNTNEAWVDSRDKPEDDGVRVDLLRNSKALIRRLAALDHALKTIPQQAKRLARIMAQREHAPAGAYSSPAAGNPLRGSLPSHPIRPGIPPGSNKQSNEPSHEVLREIHGLVRDWEKDAWERRCENLSVP